MKVTFEGRRKFAISLMPRGLLKDKEEKVILISINDTDSEVKDSKALIETYEYTLGKDALILQFQDVDVEQGNEKCITTEQAKQVVDIVHNNPDATHFKVHCFVGVSRSAAVAKFIDEFYELDTPELRDYKVYNRLVYSRLQAANGDAFELYKQALLDQDMCY